MGHSPRRKEDVQLFATNYCIGGGFYGAEIEAVDFEHARQLAAQRGLGERVDGIRENTWLGGIAGLIDRGDYVGAAHEASFLCFVGLASGAITFREALGDDGLVHELLHLAAGDPADAKKRGRRCKALAVDFANRIPGYPVHRWQGRLRTPAELPAA